MESPLTLLPRCWQVAHHLGHSTIGYRSNRRTIATVAQVLGKKTGLFVPLQGSWLT